MIVSAAILDVRMVRTGRASRAERYVVVRASNGKTSTHCRAGSSSASVRGVSVFHSGGTVRVKEQSRKRKPNDDRCAAPIRAARDLAIAPVASGRTPVPDLVRTGLPQVPVARRRRRLATERPRPGSRHRCRPARGLPRWSARHDRRHARKGRPIRRADLRHQTLSGAPTGFGHGRRSALANTSPHPAAGEYHLPGFAVSRPLSTSRHTPSPGARRPRNAPGIREHRNAQVRWHVRPRVPGTDQPTGPVLTT